jgi:hypothetical protein
MRAYGSAYLLKFVASFFLLPAPLFLLFSRDARLPPPPPRAPRALFSLLLFRSRPLIVMNRLLPFDECTDFPALILRLSNLLFSLYLPLSFSRSPFALPQCSPPPVLPPLPPHRQPPPPNPRRSTTITCVHSQEFRVDSAFSTSVTYLPNPRDTPVILLKLMLLYFMFITITLSFLTSY